MWVRNQICLKLGCKHAKESPPWQYPQVFLHESQMNRFIELRSVPGQQISRLVKKEHIGQVVVCVDHLPAHVQELIYHHMVQGHFEWSLLTADELSKAKICIGYGLFSHYARHSQWKKPNVRNPKHEWRFTPVNKNALKPVNLVVITCTVIKIIYFSYSDNIENNHSTSVKEGGDTRAYIANMAERCIMYFHPPANKASSKWGAVVLWARHV